VPGARQNHIRNALCMDFGEHRLLIGRATKVVIWGCPAITHRKKALRLIFHCEILEEIYPHRGVTVAPEQHLSGHRTLHSITQRTDRRVSMNQTEPISTPGFADGVERHG